MTNPILFQIQESLHLILIVSAINFKILLNHSILSKILWTKQLPFLPNHFLIFCAIYWEFKVQLT